MAAHARFRSLSASDLHERRPTAAFAATHGITRLASGKPPPPPRARSRYTHQQPPLPRSLPVPPGDSGSGGPAHAARRRGEGGGGQLQRSDALRARSGSSRYTYDDRPDAQQRHRGYDPINDRDNDKYYIDLDDDRGGSEYGASYDQHNVHIDEDDDDEYDSEFSVGLSSEYSASGYSEYSTRSAATDPRGCSSSSAAPRLFGHDSRGSRRGSSSDGGGGGQRRDGGHISDGGRSGRVSSGGGFTPRRVLTRGSVMSEQAASSGGEHYHRAQQLYPPAPPPVELELEGANALAPALRALLVLHFLYDPGVSFRGPSLNDWRRAPATHVVCHPALRTAVHAWVCACIFFLNRRATCVLPSGCRWLLASAASASNQPNTFPRSRRTTSPAPAAGSTRFR